VIHNAAFAEAGLDWVYVALEVAMVDLPDALVGLRALRVGGVSVTMPHKEAVVDLVDSTTAEASTLKAVNCIVPDGKRLVGHNTDGVGFIEGLRSAGRREADSAAGFCVVFGTGGAARSVACALADAGADEVRLVSRDPARSDAVAGSLGAVIRSGSPDDVERADLVVNATPLGMEAHPGQPCPADRLPEHAVAVDLVYHPIRTAWLEACAARGLPVINGIPMLVHQAAAAFELWTGCAPPLETIEIAVRTHLEAAPGPSGGRR